MSGENRDITSSRPIEKATDIISTVVSIVPRLGGPASVVLSGWVVDRKFGRVEDFMRTLAEQVKDLKPEQTQEYVAKDEFLDLLTETLRRVQDERQEEKRRAYAYFVQADIRHPGQPYDDKIEMLRALEQLQYDHLRVIKAMRQQPEQKIDRFGLTSLLATLQRRVADIPSDRINELSAKLDDLRITKISEALQVTMTPHGAADLRSRFTPFGTRFLQFLES